MTIRGILKHRALVQRSTVTNSSGNPGMTWATVTAALPCYLDASGKAQTSGMVAPSTQTSEQHRTGLVLTAPEADVRPADRLTVTIPGMANSTWVVEPAPSYVTHLAGLHHREHQVSET